MRYIHADKAIWKKLKPLARENRRRQTLSEKIIWNSVRKRQLGYYFRRQHVVYRYIVDFVCLEKNLIIEIDGISHEGKEDYDDERTRILNELGFRVIRFNNEEVESNGNMVVEKIKAELDKE